jgi:hypothetical protein
MRPVDHHLPLLVRVLVHLPLLGVVGCVAGGWVGVRAVGGKRWSLRYLQEIASQLWYSTWTRRWFREGKRARACVCVCVYAKGGKSACEQ